MFTWLFTKGACVKGELKIRQKKFMEFLVHKLTNKYAKCWFCNGQTIYFCIQV